MKNQTCSTCRYWQREEIDDGHICANIRSQHCADWTEEDMVCPYWEQKRVGK